MSTSWRGHTVSCSCECCGQGREVGGEGEERDSRRGAAMNSCCAGGHCQPRRPPLAHARVRTCARARTHTPPVPPVVPTNPSTHASTHNPLPRTTWHDECDDGDQRPTRNAQAAAMRTVAHCVSAVVVQLAVWYLQGRRHGAGRAGDQRCGVARAVAARRRSCNPRPQAQARASESIHASGARTHGTRVRTAILRS